MANDICSSDEYVPAWRRSATRDAAAAAAEDMEETDHLDELEQRSDELNEAAERVEDGDAEELERIPPYDPQAQPSFDSLRRYEFNFSVGKNKWIFNPSILAGGNGTLIPAFSANQDPRVAWAFPANVPSPPNRVIPDTLRYVSGKYWMNLGHADGAQIYGAEGVQSFLSRREDGPTSLLSFHNPTAHLSSGKHFFAEATPEEIAGGLVMETRNWINSSRAREQLLRMNKKMELPVYEEAMKIVFPPHPVRPATPEGWLRNGQVAEDNQGAGGDDRPGEGSIVFGANPPGQNQGEEGMDFFEDNNTPKQDFDEGRETVAEAQARRQREGLTIAWNWRNYMYGLNPTVFSDSGYPMNQEQLLIFARDQSNTLGYSRSPGLAADRRDSRLTWEDWHNSRYSQNMFPVIPFYGPDETFENFVEPPWYNQEYRPPKTGEQTFSDFVTNTPSFLTLNELNQTDLRSSQFYSINASYNYYDCIYEDLISQQYSENRLPNFYRFRPENFGYLRRETPEEYRLRRQLDRIASEESKERKERILELAAIQKYAVYDRKWHPTVPSWQIFTNTNLPDYKRIYDERNLFPMHTEIEFSSKVGSQFAEAMRLGDERTSMYELLLPFASKNHLFTEDITFDAAIYSRGGNRRRSRRARPRPRDLVNPIDLKTVMTFDGTGGQVPNEEGRETREVGDIINESVNYMNLDNWLVWLESAMMIDRDNPFDRARSLFSYSTIKARIKNIIEENYRESFAKILSGVPAHSEILAYRVEKLAVNESAVGESSIHNYYFATNEESDLIKFVDSQVKYGENYRYRIYQTIIVVGTEYAYCDCMSRGFVGKFFRDTEFPQTEPAKMFFGVLHTPNVKIMEIPMEEREVVVLDKPPMPPEVNIVSFRGSATRVLFNLNSGTGELYAPPIILEEDDNSQFARVALNQNASFNPQSWSPPGSVANPREVVHFKNDDPTKIFEVFRLEDEPTSWQDFYGAKIERIESTATNSSFEDSIIPNQKYYYTFRSEDEHGHVSNPTHIYQIEMVKNLETVYMKMDLFKFKEEVKERTMNFARSIQIRPSFLQSILPLPSSGRFSDWDTDKRVGNSNHPVWGKKFKFRITSKSTGKQIDLNFKFVKKHGTISEDVQNTVHISDKC